MRTPDKWVRKYFAQTLAGLQVNGVKIPVSDSNIPVNSKAHIILSTIDKSNIQETKCNRVWDFFINLDIVTVYPPNTGSRVLAEDIENAVLAACMNPDIEGFKVESFNIDFGPDLSTDSAIQTIFRKIIIYNLKLTETI